MDRKPDTWHRVSSSTAADCSVFKVRQDICRNELDGRTAEFYVIEAPDWVNIIARNKQDRIIMIEQFRHGTHEVVTEIPGGIVDEGEEPLAAAKRELLEETGYIAADWKFLGRSRPNPAIQNNWVHHFLAEGCEVAAAPAPDENESIAIKPMALSAVDELIDNGSITHSLVIAAFYYFKGYLLNENSTS